MFPFPRPRVTTFPVGVDLGFDAVRMLQFERDRADETGRLAVRAALAAPLPAGAADDHEARTAAAAEVIRQALRGGAFRGRRVVVALPREMLHLRTLRLSPMPDADLPWAVLADARDLFPFDTAQARLQFLDAGEVRQAGAGRPGGDVRREVIVAAAGDALVDEFVGRLHAAGAVVDSIDVEPCAVYRAHARPATDEPAGGEVHAAIDVGYGRSQVVIGKGDRVRVVKLIETGGRHVCQAIARRLGIPETEAAQLRRRLSSPSSGESPTPQTSADRDPVRRAVGEAGRGLMESIAREAVLCLRYHAVAFRGPGPARVRLSGSEAWDPQLQAALAAALPCPMEAADLFHGIDTARLDAAEGTADRREWAAALGLALRRVQSAPADSELTHHEREAALA